MSETTVEEEVKKPAIIFNCDSCYITDEGRMFIKEEAVNKEFTKTLESLVKYQQKSAVKLEKILGNNVNVILSTRFIPKQ